VFAAAAYRRTCLPSPTSLVELTTAARVLPFPARQRESGRHHGIVSACVNGYRSCVHTNTGSKPFRSTYYDDRMRASPALLRARAPYILKNTISGVAICALVVGICTLHAPPIPGPGSHSIDSYTINAISQDEFEDVVVPDKPLDRSVQQSLGGTAQALQQAVDARK